jgi:peptide/nickel transport system substrate-binding protein
METLVGYDEKLKLQSVLAESWESGDGGQLWTFHLRRNVRFQDDPVFKGHPRYVSAADVVFSLRRVLDPKTGTLGAFVLSDIVEGAADFAAGKTTEVSGIQAVDPYTVRFQLVREYALFPARLSLPFCAVIPKEATDQYGAGFATHPVGTGPFKLSYWDLGRGVISLERNRAYWRPISTNLDGINFVLIKSEAVQLTELAQGRIDAVEANSTVYREIADEKGVPKAAFSAVELVRSPILTVHFVGFNFANPLMHNLNLRLAANYAVDKRKLCAFVLGGLARPANGPLLASMPGGDDSPLYDQDVQKSRELLARSVYHGQPLVYMTDNSTESVAVAEFLQDQWKSVGIQTKIDKNPESVWLDKLTNGRFDLGKLYFAFDYPSPDNGLSQFLTSNFAPAGPNFLHYTNRDFDAEYNQALQTSGAESERLFGHLQNIVRQDAPWVFLYTPIRVVVVNRRVRDLRVNMLSFSLLLDTVTKTAG